MSRRRRARSGAAGRCRLAPEGGTRSRFEVARKVLEAAPLVVVEHGEPIERNMRSERLTLEEVASAARLQSIGSLDEVEWAIVEGSGQISFVRKASAGG